MDWGGMALVGRIARSHGIRGQVIVNPETDFADERFQPGAELFVERKGAVTRLRVTSARFQQGRPILGFEGVDSIDDADALAGLELRIPAERLAELPDGTYYRHDLVDCRVETVDGAAVGTVTAVEGSMDASRLVIAGAAGEVLVPLASAICRTIDVDAKRIVIDPPEGLIEANETRRAGRK